MNNKKQKRPSTMESWLILNGKINYTFYSKKEDKHLTAISTYYGRKIKTERITIVEGRHENPKASTLTRVTLLNKNKNQ